METSDRTERCLENRVLTLRARLSRSKDMERESCMAESHKVGQVPRASSSKMEMREKPQYHSLI